MDRTEAEAIYDSGRDACVKVLLALANQVERLEGRVERLEGEVRELRRDSGNSSLPPSADLGGGKRHRKGKRSSRNPGAQPGHRGSSRKLLPIEQVDEVIEHLPGSCAQCGHSLADRPARGPVRRHQVAELPEIAVAVTEHRLARRRCLDCGALTQAELPPEVPRERFGPRLQGPSPPSPPAFGSPVARWSISATSCSAPRSRSVPSTPSSVKAPQRNRFHLDPARRQVCWSHLLRDFRFHAESPLAPQSEFGEAGLRIAEEVFSAWREFQRSGDRRALRCRIGPLERELRELCEQAKRKSVKTRYHRGLARNLTKVWPALWTFVEEEGVEPTNNRAERGLRHAVIYRKLSQGSRTERGALATERLLSAAISCRLQDRSLFAYLVEVTQASIRGQPAPALV